MAAQFDDDGIRFRYPDNWTLEREDTETGWTVSLQSPGTAFMMVCLREDMPSNDQLAEAALEALREDYPELEAEDCVETVAGQPAVGHDIRFFSLDLTNTCWTRSFYSDQGTVLLLCQTSDLELEESGPVLRAICASLEVEDE
ncbi:MAG TPA: hypothetical protein VJ739_02430 [Gemmataceae bacterium]|nr:hypothetical protein [Gemmataceae bacterium]